jgi:hypothetical protein
MGRWGVKGDIVSLQMLWKWKFGTVGNVISSVGEINPRPGKEISISINLHPDRGRQPFLIVGPLSQSAI